MGGYANKFLRVVHVEKPEGAISELSTMRDQIAPCLHSRVFFWFYSSGISPLHSTAISLGVKTLSTPPKPACYGCALGASGAFAWAARSWRPRGYVWGFKVRDRKA